MFIAGIVVVSLRSRASRTTEQRTEHIEFDQTARRFLTDSQAFDGAMSIVANRRRAGDPAEYAARMPNSAG